MKDIDHGEDSERPNRFQKPVRSMVHNTWVEMNKEAFVPAGVIDAWYVG
ncbi:MAG: hypothetical protein ACTHK0_16005 [Ginsengibacter sp.]